MKVKHVLLESRVARKLFLIFICCAILPITAMVLISFGQVRSQLHEESERRLRQVNKAVGMSIYERLLLLESELKVITGIFISDAEQRISPLQHLLGEDFGLRFKGLLVISDGRESLSLFGAPGHPPLLSPDEREHIRSGKTLLATSFNEDSTPLLSMALALDPGNPDSGILYGELNSDYLWESTLAIPPMARVCILDRSNRVLYSMFEDSRALTGRLSTGMDHPHSGQFKWKSEEGRYLANYWSIFLEPNFHSTEWIVVLTESENEIMASMAGFRKTFPLVMLLSLGMVFLLSVGQIRKSMEPIETLREATHKIADGAFGVQVQIESGDEFQTLADAFNEMSRKLKEGQSLLVQTAKMGAIGQMSAGIIHEINQPMTAIFGLIELSLMDETSGTHQKLLETLQESVERLNGIITKFRTFSRVSDETMEPLCVNDVVDKIYGLLEHQFLRNRIDCVLEKREGLPVVSGSTDDLQQVVLNLIVNAMDALEEKAEGQRQIKIGTSTSEGQVLVKIEDNGSGIPAEIRDRIFDPFFTTKGAEKGTGLGMAIIESIVHKHGGKIDLDSEVGVGTAFTIALPVP